MNNTHIRQLKKLTTRFIPYRYRADLAALALRANALRYQGNGVTCPCCDGHFAHFAASPLSGLPIVCPRCLSLPRHRLLWLYLHEMTDLFSGRPMRLLHIAPEISFYLALRQRPGLDYLPADLDSPLAAERIDATDIPYPDNSFDAILCNHVLEHIPDDRAAMAEFYRVLRPGGWAILQSPLDTALAVTYEDPAIVTADERHRAYGHDDHRRLYGRDYADRLTEAGFEIRIDPFLMQIAPADRGRWGLPDHEDIYFCRKISVS